MYICLEMARQGYSSYHYYGKKKNRNKGERERTQQSNKSSMGSNKTHPVVKMLVLQTEDVGWCSVILLERRCLKYVCGERQQRPDTTVSGGCGLAGAPEPRCWIDEQDPGW